MDSSLFLKYTHLLKENSTTKELIINHIYTNTGITLSPSQIEIEKKNLILYVSSALRATLITKGINEELKKIGFVYKQ